MKIAHRFIGGIKPKLTTESAKRTTEMIDVADGTQPSVSRTAIHATLDPSNELLGYFHVVRFADGSRVTTETVNAC